MLTLESVRASYGDHRVLDDVSFSLALGETCTVLGASGCGKTTLLSLIAGLKPPEAGRILLSGAPVERGDRRIGLILQTWGLFPWFTVARNVGLGLEIQGIGKERRAKKVKAELERVGLEAYADRYPGELSGGQKQRVAIARTFVLQPELLLMDEPFSSLDALTREGLQDFLLSRLASDAVAVVLVTHSIEEAVFLGSRILLMTPRSGRIALSLEGERTHDPSFRESPRYFELCRLLRHEMEALRGADEVSS